MSATLGVGFQRLPFYARFRSLAPASVWLATVLGLLGTIAIFPISIQLWDLWTNDALRSIGMLFPLISLALILRAWRGLSWRMEGTWWGLVLVLSAIGLAYLKNDRVLFLIISRSWLIGLPPAGLVLALYAAGVALLCGGSALLRRSIFPLALLLLVNPVPHIFSLLVDVPLQHASAHIVRQFAVALGQNLTPGQLTFMFAPDFGMYIAPGCNGIRGAITMGYFALIIGYLRQFPVKLHILTVIGAVLLGYVFNFVRLCVLVLYYLVALHYPSLQNKAEGADYLIGACLFLSAALLLFWLLRKTTPAEDEPREDTHAAAQSASPSKSRFAGAQYAKLVTLGLVVLAASVSYAGDIHRLVKDRTGTATHTEFDPAFPAQSGLYQLSRTWKEQVTATRQTVYDWAEYRIGSNGAWVDIGVSPVLGAHDTLICHMTRGEDPLWQGTSQFATADSQSVSFSISFYNDGVSQFLEAGTQCNASGCGEYLASSSHLGFLYSMGPHPELSGNTPSRPVPILIRVATTDTLLGPEAARKQLIGQLNDFMPGISLKILSKPYLAR